MKVLIGIIVVAGFVYLADDLYARWRHEPYADVRVDRILAINEKFNKVDYERTDPVTERCLYSLFPHSGHNPCWYVTRHTLRIIRIG